MIPNEIKNNLSTLSRTDKFHIIQFLLKELAKEEEKELSHYFNPGTQHELWSQYDSYEAAQKLQFLLET